MNSWVVGNQPAIGILGGGQLARMLCLAAARLGIATATMDPKSPCPAAPVSQRHLHADWNDPEQLNALAEGCDALTTENEFVDGAILQELNDYQTYVVPNPLCLLTVQDKYVQKETLRSEGVPTLPARKVATLSELREAAEEFGWPLILKSRKNGYDGKGNRTVKSEAELETAWKELRSFEPTLMAEKYCEFLKEIAVIVCRSVMHQTVVYPVVETIQENHVCRFVKAPAALTQECSERAVETAISAIDAVKGTGCFGVEMFLTHEEKIFVNELAPRVHNSGHYTIEGCRTSQFENHLRAVLGWPLGQPEMVRPAAVMVNLLGDRDAPPYPTYIPRILKEQDAGLHWYGKDRCKPGRKMGHFTVLDDSMNMAMYRAEKLLESLKYQPRIK